MSSWQSIYQIVRSYPVDLPHQELSPSSSPFHESAFHTSTKEKGHSSVKIHLGVSYIGVIAMRHRL